MPFSQVKLATFSEFFERDGTPKSIYIVFDVFDATIVTQSWRAEYRIVGEELAALPTTEPERMTAVRAIVAREAHVAYDAWSKRRGLSHPSVRTKSSDDLREMSPILSHEYPAP